MERTAGYEEGKASALSAGIILASVVFHIPFLIGRGFIFYLVSVIACAVPLAGYSLYAASVAKEKHLRDYNERSVLYRFLRSRRIICAAVITVCSALSAVLPVAVYLFSSAEYLAFLVSAASIVLLTAAQRHLLGEKLRIYSEKAAEYHLLRGNLWIFLFSALFVYPLSVFLFRSSGVSVPFCHGSADALSYSPAVHFMASVLSSFSEITDAVLSSRTASVLADDAFLALSLILCQGGVIILALSRVAMFFFIGRSRLIMGITGGTGRLRSLILSLLAVIAAMLIIISSAVRTGMPAAEAEAAAELVTVAVERIDGMLYREGTRLMIEEEGRRFTSRTRSELEAAVNDYFDAMARNADSYLDWYYSIGGQYSQLWNMLKGIVSSGIEDAVASLMEEKMTELMSPDYELAVTLESIIDDNDALFRAAASRILDENKIRENAGEEYVVVASASFEDIVSTSRPDTIFTPSLHAALGIGAGTASGIIIGRLAARSLRSAAGKLAVKAASRPIISRFTGAKAGAILGTLAGPVGTAVGFAGGLAAGELASWAAIKLDESFNREEYKASILEDIEAMRLETLSEIGKL